MTADDTLTAPLEMTEEDIDALIDLYTGSPVPCEFDRHETLHFPTSAQAEWLVSVACPACPHRATYLICEPGRVLITTPGVGLLTCADCEHAGDPPEFVTAIIPMELT